MLYEILPKSLGGYSVTLTFLSIMSVSTLSMLESIIQCRRHLWCIGLASFDLKAVVLYIHSFHDLLFGIIYGYEVVFVDYVLIYMCHELNLVLIGDFGSISITNI